MTSKKSSKQAAASANCDCVTATVTNQLTVSLLGIAGCSAASYRVLGVDFKHSAATEPGSDKRFGHRYKTVHVGGQAHISAVLEGMRAIRK
jgi:hypothetical protein